MNRICLSRIEVEAFKNFADTSTLDVASLPVGLHMVRGRNLVSKQLGSNGSGKSSFFSDAPTWCLSGQTSGGLKTTDVRSWLTKGRPRVALTLQSGKEEITIQRGPRATDLSVNGRAVSQDEVDALDGLNHTIRCQAIFMGQGAPLFLDLTPRDKMGVLSDALGLERWEARAQAASARGRALEERARMHQGKISGLETARNHAQEALTSAHSASSGWAEEHIRQLEKLRLTARQARARADELEERRKKESLTWDTVGTQAQLLRPSVESARTELRTRQMEVRGVRGEIASVRRAIEDAEKKLAAFAELGECPTCGQAVTKKDAARHAAELRADVAQRRKLVSQLEKSESVHNNTISLLEARLSNEEPRLKKLEADETRTGDALRLLERGVGEAQGQATAAEKLLEQVESEENPHRSAAQEARNRLDELVRALQEEEEVLKRVQSSAERAQFWARGFREIRLGVIDSVVADLTDTTSEVLDGLGIGDWEVRYTTEQETKSGSIQRALVATVRSPSAPEGIHWESYSGGERQRLRLAGALALSEVLLAHAGSSLDYRVLDEPTRGLSREGVRDLIEVLNDYAQRSKLKIFYIDHTSEDSSQFESVITVIGRPDGAVVASN